MKRWRFYTLASASMLALVVAPLVSSLPQANGWADDEEQTASAPATAAAPPLDPAFAKYVDIDLLLDAWSDLDPALMTDVALQLAEGERVLLRSHKAGSAADLLALAARLAGSKNDQESLERIAKAAKLIDSDEVAEQVASAAKLAGASRADEPALKVSVAQADVSDIAFYSGAVQGIKAAELVGDVDAITHIRDNVDSFEGLTDQQKEYLKTIAGSAIDSSGDVGDSNSVASSLRKLSGTSRGGFYIGLPGGGGIGFGGGGFGHGGHNHGGNWGHGGSNWGHGGGSNWGHGGGGGNWGHGGGGSNWGHGGGSNWGHGGGSNWGHGGGGNWGHGGGHSFPRRKPSRWGHGGGWGHGGWSGGGHGGWRYP